ncbi:hypothetical protein HNR30_009083 [Nonomuraea soli]|uniref:Uncharacterized protein n=1 Tax=Nonomuraea soli TaxID=1032476 RepID=A0A7W0CUR9_9ACTN|nr:hypothetical protein [Nonomuraea soli]
MSSAARTTLELSIALNVALAAGIVAALLGLAPAVVLAAGATTLVTAYGFVTKVLDRGSDRPSGSQTMP